MYRIDLCTLRHPYIAGVTPVVPGVCFLALLNLVLWYFTEYFCLCVDHECWVAAFL